MTASQHAPIHARTVEQLQDNLGAAGLHLTDDETALLDVAGALAPYSNFGSVTLAAPGGAWATFFALRMWLRHLHPACPGRHAGPGVRSPRSSRCEGGWITAPAGRA